MMRERLRRLRGHWPHIRAALIAFAVGVNVFQGLPVPNINYGQLQRPVGHAELMRWTGVLNDIGVDISSTELMDLTVTVSRDLSGRHGEIMAPIWPWFHHTNTRQRWSLFPIADSDPWWMHIEARTASGDWELLYRPNDDDADFLDEVLEYRRIRGVWNPGREVRPDHQRFVDLVARRVFERYERYERVRVRYERYHLNLPGHPNDPERSWHFTRVRRRSDFE